MLSKILSACSSSIKLISLISIDSKDSSSDPFKSICSAFAKISDSCSEFSIFTAGKKPSIDSSSCKKIVESISISFVLISRSAMIRFLCSLFSESLLLKSSVFTVFFFLLIIFIPARFLRFQLVICLRQLLLLFQYLILHQNLKPIQILT